jgi:2,4-dienoyl-CoA reductase-like NADH-dependent reductase (Old Yellow Enzyme family)
LITEAEQAEHIIVTEEADAVFLGKAMLRNPRWALAASEKLGVKIDWPRQFEWSRTLR